MEKEKLLQANRELRIEGPPAGQVNFESDWALKMSENIARQAQLKHEVSRKLDEWDRAHGVKIAYQSVNGRKAIRKILIPGRETAKVSMEVAYLGDSNIK